VLFFSNVKVIPFLKTDDSKMHLVDIFASQSSMPEESSNDWGYSLNLGWIWFRGSHREISDVDSTCSLLDLTIAHMMLLSPRPSRDARYGKNPNDQISLNLVLLAAGTQWYHSVIQDRSSGALGIDFGVVTGREVQTDNWKATASVATAVGASQLSKLVGLKLAMSSPEATYRSPCIRSFERDLILHNIHCDARNHEKVFALQRSGVWWLHQSFTDLFTGNDERRKKFHIHWINIREPLRTPEHDSSNGLALGVRGDLTWLLHSVAIEGNFSGIKVVKCRSQC
jgi:hypothetical protein